MKKSKGVNVKQPLDRSPRLSTTRIKKSFCPICAAEPVTITTRPPYGAAYRIYERVVYACGMAIEYESGKSTVGECGHLKDIMKGLLLENPTIDELLTGDSALERVLARVRLEESERKKHYQEKREKDLENEYRERGRFLFREDFFD